MQYYVVRSNTSDELMHHGVKGMKWGVRRFQKKDGTLTPAGVKRYSTVGDDDLRAKKEAYKSAKRDYNRSFDDTYNKAFMVYSPVKKHRQDNDKRWEDAVDKAEKLRQAKAEYKQTEKEYKEVNKDALAARRKTAIKVGAAAVGTALAVYGTYKLSKYVKNNRSVIDNGKKRAEQLAYLQRNINNTQSHVDPASKLYRTDQWKHAFDSTINSRQSSIKGDRALYGAKSVAGRDAIREARYSSYESLVRGDWDKKIKRL